MSEYRQHPGPAAKRATCAAARRRGAPRPTCGQGRNRAPTGRPPRSMPPTAPLSLPSADRLEAEATRTDSNRPSAARFRTASEEGRTVARGVLDRARGVRRGVGRARCHRLQLLAGSANLQRCRAGGFHAARDLSATSLADFTVDWDALKAINPDTVGWIYIPGTVVNYPIVQRPTTRSTSRTTSRDRKAGSPRSAPSSCRPRTASDFSDPNNIIYGHHLNDGSMFACVADFSDAAQFNDHRTVYILTPEGNYELSTFALVHVAADDPLAQMRFADEDERVAYVQDKIDRSVVPASDIPAASDIKHTFALATCDNLPSDGRYVLYLLREGQHGGRGRRRRHRPRAVAAIDSAEQEIAS